MTTRTAGLAERAPVAITGIGLVSPLGVGREAFWRALTAGESGVGPAAAHAPGGFPAVVAAVRGFDPRGIVENPLLRRMDELSRRIVASCRLALVDAGLAADATPPDRVAIAVGSAHGDTLGSTQQLDKLFERGPGSVSPMLFPNLVLNAPASYAALELGASGPNLTVAQSETSAEQAILAGCDQIRAGRADLVLAGGGEELSEIVVAIYARSGVLAGDARAAQARPYDARRSGLVLGEGACMLALEPLERARRRGARVIATLAEGVSFGVEARRGFWPRSALTAVASLRHVAAGAELVVGCGNGTRLLDRIELELLDALLGARAGEVALTSLKGAIGEIAGGGAFGVAAAALAVERGLIPPTVGFEQPEPGHRIAPVSGRALPRAVRRALVVTLARGGSGTALSVVAPG